MTLCTNIGVIGKNIRSNNLWNPFYGASVSAGSDVSVSHSRLLTTNQQYLAAFKRTFSGHTIDVLAGYESYNYKYQYLYGWNKKIYNPTVGELDNCIYGLNPSPVASSYTNTYATQGFLGRVQYDFQEKYFFSASYRRDASSRFAPENRWGNFYSVGGAWLINKEGFMKNLTWLSTLKLKASYGMQGNDGLGNYYPYLDQYSVGNNNGEFAVSMSYKGNRDITWEKSQNINAGLEFGLFNERITANVEFFNRVSTDLLYNLPVAPSNGYTSFPMNVGAIRNRGVELEIGAAIVNTRDIQWSLSLNATHYKNTILDLHESVRETGIKGSRFIYEIGGSLYDSYYREYAGVDPESGLAQYYKDVVDEQGNVTGRELTTDYSSATQYNNGTTLPSLMGGFATSLTAYGFDLSAQFGYQLGGKIYDFGYEELMHNGQSSMGGTNWHFDILNAWTPDNPNSNIPRLNATDDTQAELHPLPGKLKLSGVNNVTLGYTAFLKKWTEKIKGCQITLLCYRRQSLGILGKTRLGSRQDFGGTDWAKDLSAYSALRTISGSISITF